MVHRKTALNVGPEREKTQNDSQKIALNMVHKNMKLNINNMKLNIVRQQHELRETHMARRLRRYEREAKFQYSEMEPTTSCMVYRFQKAMVNF